MGRGAFLNYLDQGLMSACSRHGRLCGTYNNAYSLSRSAFC